MSEENIVLDEELPPEPNMTPEERQIAIDRKLADSKLKRKPRAKKKSAPIKKFPADSPREAYNIETTGRAMNQPWRPASILTARKKEGMRSRWVRKDLLEKRIEEGWTPRVSNSRSRVESPEQTLIDGRPLSTYTTKRNLVLCDMPEELAQSREAYFKKINDAGLASQKAEFKDQTSVGGASYGYGDVKVEK